MLWLETHKLDLLTNYHLSIFEYQSALHFPFTVAASADIIIIPTKRQDHFIIHWLNEPSDADLWWPICGHSKKMFYSYILCYKIYFVILHFKI